ncbi:MAG: type II toxin-antitoxin system RelE family toxin [Mycobacteriales bacterium]
MRYSVIINAAAQRGINGLPRKIADVVLHFVYNSLAQRPYQVGKPLRWEWEGYYAARRGTYRIVYAIDNEQVVVTVVKVAGRAGVYRSR